MIRIASGVTDQLVYFSAPPGLTGHTVDRARNTTSFTAMTTPTVTEMGSDGDYALLLDEDMAIGAGNLTEAMVFKIKASGMSTTRIEVELFDPTNYVVGTVTVNTDMRGTDGANTTAPDNTGIAAIQAKTDNLSFSKVNEADVNVQSVNGVTVTGTGTSADPWGP